MESSATEHWQACEVCGFEKPESRKPHSGGLATCQEKAQCVFCHAKYGEKDTDNHTKTTYHYEPNADGAHKKIYDCCNKVAEQAEACTGGTATCTEQKVCEDCGASYGNSLGHDFSVDKHDADHHWLKCSRCEEIDSKEAHYGGTATCTEQGVCSGCDVAYGSTLGHDFTVDKHDGEYHWQKCSRCEETDGKETHHGGTATCTEQKVCTDCGTHYGSVLGHDFTVDKHDADYHWQKCSRCEEIDGKEAHHGGAATCTGQKVCADCGTPYGNTLGHDFTVDKHDADHHWKKCSRCEEIDGKEAHYGGTATCTEQKVCEKCDASYGNTLGHDFSVNKHDADSHWQKCSRCNETTGKEAHRGGTATCTEKKVCEDCGASYGNTLGHDFAVDKQDADYHWQKCSRCEEIDGKEAHHGGTATCTEQKNCGDCGVSYGSALGHDFSIGKRDADDHWQKCSRCEEIDSKEAHYGGTATCTEQAICQGCNASYGKYSDHDFSVAKCDADYHWKKCSRCDATDDKEAHYGGTAACTEKKVCTACGVRYGGVLNHDYEDTVTPPTESQKGYTTHTCKHCGYSYVDTYTDPTGPNCITSSVFTIQGQYLQKVTSGTTVKQLLAGLNEGSYCKVYKNTAEAADNTLVGTGMTVKLIVAGKVVQELTIIVTGDTNGDGKITATDMLSLKAHLLGKSILTGNAAQAADVSGDGKITATDFLQIKAHLLGKSQIKPH